MRPKRRLGERGALRALLAERSSALAAEAVRSGGQVPPDRLDELGRLARLVDLHGAARPAWGRWTVPLVAAGTMIGASLLLFTRMRTTEVVLELKVSELSFVLPTLQVITGPLRTSSLIVSGLRGVELPGSGPGATRSLRIDAERQGERVGSVTLDPVTAPSGSRLFLRRIEGQSRYRMHLAGATAELGVSVDGPVRLVSAASHNDKADFAYPRRIALQPDSNGIRLELALADHLEGPRVFQAPLPAQSLVFSRVDQFQQSERMIVRQIPTIQAGTVYFESLDGQARPLRAGEALLLPWAAGELRELQLQDDGITLRFHGSVRGMSTGSGATRRSLMPTVLDWMRAQHGLWLLWATTGYALGLFASLRTWWRQPT
jgi:hypothetical protein